MANRAVNLIRDWPTISSREAAGRLPNLKHLVPAGRPQALNYQPLRSRGLAKRRHIHR